MTMILTKLMSATNAESRSRSRLQSLQEASSVARDMFRLTTPTTFKLKQALPLGGRMLPADYGWYPLNVQNVARTPGQIKMYFMLALVLFKKITGFVEGFVDRSRPLFSCHVNVNIYVNIYGNILISNACLCRCIISSDSRAMILLLACLALGLTTSQSSGSKAAQIAIITFKLRRECLDFTLLYFTCTFQLILVLVL